MSGLIIPASIFTKTGAPAVSTTVTLIAADAAKRPFVSYAESQASAGTMDIKIGSMVICSAGRNRSGLWVGAAGDTVTVVTDGSAAGTEYIVTCGVMADSGGSNIETIGTTEAGVFDS